MRNMWIVALACGLVMFAGGCATKPEPIVVDKSIVVVAKPPETLYKCPQIKQFPNPETLTNKEVAQVISRLVEANMICGINMDQIKAYIERAEKTHGTVGGIPTAGR